MSESSAATIAGCIPASENISRFHQRTGVCRQNQSGIMELGLGCRRSSSGRTIRVIGDRIGIGRPKSVQVQGRIAGVHRASRIGRTAPVTGSVPTAEGITCLRQPSTIAGQRQIHAEDFDLIRRQSTARRAIIDIGHREGVRIPFRIQYQCDIIQIIITFGEGDAAAVGRRIPSGESRPRLHQGAAVRRQAQGHAGDFRLCRRRHAAGRAICIVGHRIGGGICGPLRIHGAHGVNRVGGTCRIMGSAAICGGIPTGKG